MIFSTTIIIKHITKGEECAQIKKLNQNREKEKYLEERIQQKNGQKIPKQIESKEEKEIYF